jgi:8-amino-7-oxononanoate synthase
MGRIHFFIEELLKYPVVNNYWIESLSAIQAINIGGNALTKHIASRLQEAGFDVRAILSPTVKEGEERLRICLHVYNTEEEISQLLYKLNDVLSYTKSAGAIHNS